jgi:hypothetical protein
MRRLTYISVLSLLFSSCSGSADSTALVFSEEGAYNSDEEGSLYFAENGLREQLNEAVINNIHYNFDVLSALDFLEIKGEHPSPKDEQSLRNESVVILEIQTLENIQDIFLSEKLTFNKEDAIKYLVGDVAADFTLVQDKEEFTPTGVQYDGMLTGTTKIRLFIFYKNVNVKREVKFKFYDQLFGAGMINLKHQETISI